jgi:hypothetical protein
VGDRAAALANAGLQAMSLAEARSGRPSRLAQLAGRFLGG